MARFFIDRPIFAWVIAIVIMLAGILAIKTLPVAMYPAIAPPSVQINGRYPGASAKTVEDSVTQVIEQKMNGIDHLSYISSTSDSSGQATVTLTFEAGTDADIAQVQVQNKLQLAMSLLPQEVQSQGLQVTKATRNFFMVLGFYSEDGSMTMEDLADYVSARVQDVISRLDGVGDINMFSFPYAMRIWLDPNKLNSFKLTPADVGAAIRAQNAQLSAGQLGGAPAVQGQQINATISAQSRLQTPEQFENILLRVNKDGSTVLLRDVAKVELGSENYDFVSRFNGRPAAGMALKLATGANALETADRIKAKLDELAKFFPPGMKAAIPFDTTPFIKISIKEVVKTLVEAIILVFLVMYLFLQNFRATLIPTIAVPVVLLGTFGVLEAFGYSINTLTMFGTVLAIGLLVDDAIVVVENVERVMREDGLSPKEATRKSMDQITSALVGIALVLAAVFVPMAFFGGSTGVIYRQFSITIVSAMALSVLVALVLTPALCATMLKPIDAGRHEAKRGFFGWFNRLFAFSSDAYQTAVGRTLKKSARYVVIYAVIVVGVGLLFLRMPTGFLPDEDQGVMFTQIMLPVGATQARSLEVIKQVENYLLTEEKDAVRAMMAVAGFSFAGRGQNAAIAFVNLKDWEQREHPGLGVKDVAGRAMRAFSRIRDAMVFAFTPPAVIELGQANGFDLELKDLGGLGHEALTEARDQFLRLAAQNPNLMAVRPNGQDDTPQLHLEVDYAKAGALSLAVADINAVLSTAWGGTYVNDFIDKGRVKKVYTMGEASARMLPDDLYKWYVRNGKGEMVPFSAFATARWTYGSPRLERYNGFPAMEILGQPAPGKSSGQALAAVEEIIAQLPAGIGYEWTGLSYQERMSGSQAPALYAISALVVFLCLAALYESWSVPFAVMLVVPLGVIGALGAAGLRGLSNDVYFQVGLLTTMGLAAKNAILIVEFAKSLHEGGMGLIEATLEAARLRLRPILMTSFAFMLGVLPLAVANGAGSASQNDIGTGVMGGMFSATVLGVLFVPLFFVLVSRIARARKKQPEAGGQPASGPPALDSGLEGEGR